MTCHVPREHPTFVKMPCYPERKGVKDRGLAQETKILHCAIALLRLTKLGGIQES